MSEKLFRLLFEDRRTRYRVHVTSMLIAFTWALYRNLQVRVPESLVALEVVIIIFVSVFAQTLHYCTVSHAEVRSRLRRMHRREVLSRIAEAMAGVYLVLLGFLGRIEAAIFGWVLSGVVSGELKAARLEQVRAMVSAATRTEISAAPAATAKAAQRILEAVDRPDLTDTAWGAAEALAEYRSFVASKQGPGRSLKSDAVGTSAKPRFGRFARVESLRLVDFLVVLDNTEWLECDFYNCTIRYEGNTLDLTHVRFWKCHFQVERNRNGLAFVESLLRSRDAQLEVTVEARG